MNARRLAVLVMLGVALACLAGVLNGMYTMGMMTEAGEALAASAIDAKINRASTYGYTAVSCTVLAMILLFVDWRETNIVPALQKYRAF